MKFGTEDYKDGCERSFLGNDLMRQDDIILSTKDDILRVCENCNCQSVCIENLDWVKNKTIQDIAKEFRE